jgi:hypothetical protein
VSAWAEVKSLDGHKTYMVNEEALWLVLAVTHAPDDTSMLMQLENVASHSKKVITAMRLDA